MRPMTTQHEHSPAPDLRAPLILTLELAQPAQDLFQSLRDRHFPPERNVVPAHVSMFHALPSVEAPAILRRLRVMDHTRPPVRVEAPFLLGRGVGFRLNSPALSALRGGLARDWTPWLSPQDRQGYRAHVTVQNKVSPEEARSTLQRLAAGFVPFDTEGAALRLWRYLGGPWEALERIELAVPSPD